MRNATLKAAADLLDARSRELKSNDDWRRGWKMHDVATYLLLASVDFKVAPEYDSYMSEPDSTLAIASKLNCALNDFQAAARDLESILAQPIEFVFQVRVSASITLKLSRGEVVKLAEESVRSATAKVNKIAEEFKNATYIDPPRGGRDDL